VNGTWNSWASIPNSNWGTITMKQGNQVLSNASCGNDQAQMTWASF
jgi:hypothetical protein